MNTNESMLSLNDIEDVLECVICLEFPRTTPIYQCDNGHVLCNTCHGRVTDCPTCRGRLGKVRCLAMEKVLAKFPLPCKFNKYGCGVRLEQTQLEQHEQICYCKPASCPLPDCPKIISGKELEEHLYEKHTCIDAYYSEVVARISDIKDRAKNSNTNNLFSWNLKQSDMIGLCWRSFGNWNVSVYQLNHNHGKKNSNFTISIRNSDLGEQLSYSGQCLTLDMKLSKVTTIGRCLTINDETARRCSIDGALYITYSVDDNVKQLKSNWFPIAFIAYLFILFLYNFWL